MPLWAGLVNVSLFTDWLSAEAKGFFSPLHQQLNLNSKPRRAIVFHLVHEGNESKEDAQGQCACQGQLEYGVHLP